MTIPIALTIAGSDSSGGAGIQADLKTFAAFGVYGASVITALTAQNTKGVTGIHQVPADFVTAQIDAVFGDLDVKAVKIGMVSQRAVIEAIVAGLERWSPKHIVLDPVMVATSGDRLLAPDEIEALRTKLIPRASLITPNLPEAAALLDEPVASSETHIGRQGKRLLAMGCDAVLIKGGHGKGAESIDYLIRAAGVIALAAPRIATKTPTAPDARCPRPSRPASPKTAIWKPPFAMPKPGSVLRLPPPIASTSATATVRSIIFTRSIRVIVAIARDTSVFRWLICIDLPCPCIAGCGTKSV